MRGFGIYLIKSSYTKKKISSVPGWYPHIPSVPPVACFQPYLTPDPISFLLSCPCIFFLHVTQMEGTVWSSEQQMARGTVGGSSSGNVWGPRSKSKVVYSTLLLSWLCTEKKEEVKVFALWEPIIQIRSQKRVVLTGLGR